MDQAQAFAFIISWELVSIYLKLLNFICLLSLCDMWILSSMSLIMCEDIWFSDFRWLRLLLCMICIEIIFISLCIRYDFHQKSQPNFWYVLSHCKWVLIYIMLLFSCGISFLYVVHLFLLCNLLICTHLGGAANLFTTWY